MAICRIYTKIGLIIGALLICFSTSAQAGWVLYDDFSDADWTDKWEYGPKGSHPDLTWTQSGGVLKLIKTPGTLDIVKASRLIPRNFPPTANGIRYDIRVTSVTGVKSDDTMRCTSRVRTDGYPFIFEPGSGNEEMERYVDVNIEAYNVLGNCTINFQQDAFCESKINENHSINMHYSRGWIETHNPLGIWTKVSIQQGIWAGFIDLKISNPTQQHQYSRMKLPWAGDVLSNPYFILQRVKYASAGIAFTIEIDDVYYHTGAFEPEIESSGSSTVTTKTIVIPLL